MTVAKALKKHSVACRDDMRYWRYLAKFAKTHAEKSIAYTGLFAAHRKWFGIPIILNHIAEYAKKEEQRIADEIIGSFHIVEGDPQ